MFTFYNVQKFLLTKKGEYNVKNRIIYQFMLKSSDKVGVYHERTVNSNTLYRRSAF